ncbi:MAG: (d)CMP kinase [Planctomycetia bacterium]|nr:(d)CMP kinase [Planctomycetia bacterium]
MIITIDGPAGSGKSAAAELLARRLSTRHLDTGAMYRSVALQALNHGFSTENSDPKVIGQLASAMNLTFDWRTHPAKILLDGMDVSSDIRKPAVTAMVYLAADNTAVRTELVRRQRAVAAESDSLVTEGRDQGTLVFPDADFKFYLDADIQERARRRLDELTRKGIVIDAQAVLADMEIRDQRDRNRDVGALKLAPDAIVVDTTAMTLPEVVDTMIRIIGKQSHG